MFIKKIKLNSENKTKSIRTISDSIRKISNNIYINYSNLTLSFNLNESYEIMLCGFTV